VPSEKFDGLEPTLEQLAGRTSHRRDVVVAKLNIRANDVPDVQRAWVNCMLYPKGGGQVTTRCIDVAYCCRCSMVCVGR